MEVSDDYSVVRTFGPGRPPLGRWEVYDLDAVLVGVIAEEQEPGGGADRRSTFAAVYNPSPTPFLLRYPRQLRARGAWWSGGHATVPAAVAALACHLAGRGGGPARHFVTQSR